MKSIVLLGPAHPLRGGGMTTFNHRLANEFIKQGYNCQIVSFSLQYPSFLFPGKSQYTTEAAPEGLEIHSLINSINPLNWVQVGNRLRRQKPDLVVVRFWLPLMGPALGTILRLIKKNGNTKIVCIADNVLPHEKRLGDKPFTKYFLGACDAFLTMSEKVFQDLRTFEKYKPARLTPHPLYDNFGPKVLKDPARKHLDISPRANLVLFFGFIRKYKGLDLLLQAMADDRVKAQNIKLLVAGEFYEDKAPYQKQIKDLDLTHRVILHNRFIPDAEVAYYFGAADCVVQPYRSATQSGVTPLAYHFKKPMIVTNVGGLPSLVPHEKSGLVAEPQPKALAEALLRFYQLGESHFTAGLVEEKEKLSWTKFTEVLFQLADEVKV